MRISLVQTALVWEDQEANRKNFTQRVKSIKDTDLIVLPEMFATGFTMSPEGVAETMYDESVLWMQKTAIVKDCAITGSLVIKEGDEYYNRLFFVYPDGGYKIYDKRHLFTLAGEEKSYTAGSHKLVLEYRGWKICPLICYDLRFPVFSRNTEDFDLLLYVANWPKLRVQAWDMLLRARAIENMCYVAGVNRIGQDNNNYEYSGHSQVIDYMGGSILEPMQDEGVYTVTLDKVQVQKAREKFGFLNDKDDFTLLNQKAALHPN
ncbi:amidohydrolase [uncultured Flavobacterium sp.]|uniref:amidohydrolase n=1 Tax=uncultured Flavobacterium sp. TaxID=165435 RepID=UPI0025DC7F6A|nr:amidohydrolase [uncultured Flavobacterium sp.]